MIQVPESPPAVPPENASPETAFDPNAALAFSIPFLRDITARQVSVPAPEESGYIVPTDQEPVGHSLSGLQTWAVQTPDLEASLRIPLITSGPETVEVLVHHALPDSDELNLVAATPDELTAVAKLVSAANTQYREGLVTVDSTKQAPRNRSSVASRISSLFKRHRTNKSGPTLVNK